MKSIEVPPGLEASVLKAIRETRAAPPRRHVAAWGMAIAASLAIAIAGISYWQRPAAIPQRAEQEKAIGSLYQQVGSVMRIGLGDHVHCSIFRSYPKNPPSAAQFAKDLGPAYQELVPALEGKVPPQYRLVMAHRCGYRGRRFVHLAFKDGKSVMSLVIADRADGETFGAGSGFSTAAARQYRIAGFETSRHLVFFVSDLSERRNLEMMAACAPAVRGVLTKIEG